MTFGLCCIKRPEAIGTITEICVVRGSFGVGVTVARHNHWCGKKERGRDHGWAELNKCSVYRVRNEGGVPPTQRHGLGTELLQKEIWRFQTPLYCLGLRGEMANYTALIVVSPFRVRT